MISTKKLNVGGAAMLDITAKNSININIGRMFKKFFCSVKSRVWLRLYKELAKQNIKEEETPCLSIIPVLAKSPSLEGLEISKALAKAIWLTEE